MPVRLAITAFSVALVGCVECPQAPGLDRATCQTLAGLALPATPPSSPGNRVADDERAALLGFALFFDARLSANAQVRCATCHLPERVFGDGKPTSTGLRTVTRNSPSLFAAAWHRWQMWDGRADSLWSQPLLAFENPDEMDFTRLELAHRVAATYRQDYERLFGPLPPLADAVRFPPRGKPGDAAWETMAEVDRHEVNRVAANVGKALEAYQRRLALRPGRFDAFVLGDDGALSALERDGLRVFFAAGCITCHAGPLLSDDDFHALAMPPPERARAGALEALAASPFSAAGPFHDGPPGEVPAPRPEDEGAFRTPSLRNVARTGPWGHDGAHATLEAAVDSHLPEGLSAPDRAALLAFLRALDAGDPPEPWSNWPDR
jgi:cytochrome c peroxidase